jgi:hypothetical protein
MMQSREKNIKDGFGLLASSNRLLRFRLVVNRDLANPGKSSSGIRQIPASYLPELLGWEECGG